MLILRSNPNGGHPLKKGKFPLHQDKDGNFGVLLGYDKDGDKLLMSLSLATDFANAFSDQLHKFTHQFKKDVCPLRVRIVRWLLGQEGIDDPVDKTPNAGI